MAAIGDKYADSSIGNVTGSNAVNVFLGKCLGVAFALQLAVKKILIRISHSYLLFGFK